MASRRVAWMKAMVTLLPWWKEASAAAAAREQAKTLAPASAQATRLLLPGWSAKGSQSHRRLE